MSFIRKIIGPDEKFIGIGRVHWIYAFKGFAWIIGLMGIALFAERTLIFFIGNFATVHVIGNYFFWCAAAVGGVLSWFYFLMWIATEIGLTDKRVIYKRGLIFVDVKEVDLEEIKAAEVDYGLLGRFLNYGYVFFDARFVDNVSLPAIDDPYRFVKALNEMRSSLKQDSMKIVLEGQQGMSKNVEMAQSGEQKAKVESEKQEIHKLEEERYNTDISEPLMPQMPSMQTPPMPEVPAQPSQKRHVKKPNVIVFPRNIQEKKEMLRRRVKSTFARNTQKEKA